VYLAPRVRLAALASMAALAVPVSEKVAEAFDTRKSL
jgi:hypothetical protein